MNSDLVYRQIQPDHSLVDFVDCFWMLETQTDQARDVVVLPDGRIDLVLASKNLASHCVETGIDYAIRSMEKPSDHAPIWSTFRF